MKYIHMIINYYVVDIMGMIVFIVYNSNKMLKKMK
jgi:hypothetical protein